VDVRLRTLRDQLEDARTFSAAEVARARATVANYNQLAAKTAKLAKGAVIKRRQAEQLSQELHNRVKDLVRNVDKRFSALMQM
jgi:hypothetical protein